MLHDSSIDAVKDELDLNSSSFLNVYGAGDLYDKARRKAINKAEYQFYGIEAVFKKAIGTRTLEEIRKDLDIYYYNIINVEVYSACYYFWDFMYASGEALRGGVRSKFRGGSGTSYEQEGTSGKDKLANYYYNLVYKILKSMGYDRRFLIL